MILVHSGGTQRVVTAYGSASVIYGATFSCVYTTGEYDCNIVAGRGPIQAPITSIT